MGTVAGEAVSTPTLEGKFPSRTVAVETCISDCDQQFLLAVETYISDCDQHFLHQL